MALKIVFASGKGGVGKSSAAAGISRALAKRNFNVLLADFDIGLRSLDIMLGVSERVAFDWGDAVCGRCEAEAAMLDCGGISFFAAPQEFEESFTPDRIREFFLKYDGEYDVIIFDAPAGLGRGFELACAAADRACLVTTPDAVCVRSCAAAARAIRHKTKAELRLIINRFEKKPVTKKHLLNIDECIDAVSVRLSGVIPDDSCVVTSSVTGKIPPANSKFTKACDRIARRIMGERLKLFEGK